MSFRQLRKLPGIDSIVKELAEKFQQSQVEQGVEDVTLFRQNRVDYDEIAFTDTNTQTFNGDHANTDTVALADTETTLLQNSGQFTISANSDGSDQTRPLLIGYGDIGA